MEKKNPGKKIKRKFVKIPQKKKVVLLNSALVLGMLLLAVSFMAIASYAVFGHVYFPPLACALFLVVIVLFLLVFGVSQNGFLLFLGIDFLIGACLMFFYILGLIPLKIYQLWPLVAVASGISIFLVGLYKYRSPKSKYVFPSLVLLAIGTLFFLFSARIIKVTFISWFLKFWPFFILLAGFALIAIFVIQQKKEGLFPLMVDEDENNPDDDVFDSQVTENLLKRNSSNQEEK